MTCCIYSTSIVVNNLLELAMDNSKNNTSIVVNNWLELAMDNSKKYTYGRFYGSPEEIPQKAEARWSKHLLDEEYLFNRSNSSQLFRNNITIIF